MGCSASRLDENEEGRIPVTRLGFFGGRIETKRQRQVWNVTAGLLGAEEDGKSHEKMATAEKEKTKEKDRRKWNKNVAARDEEEVLPGSPSFRVYFLEDAASKESDDDSVKVIRKIKEGRLPKQKERLQAKGDGERVKTHEIEQYRYSLISSEDSSNKPKKERGWRFKALTRAQSRVYSFFAVKGCYGPGPSSDASPDQSPRHHDAKPS